MHTAMLSYRRLKNYRNQRGFSLIELLIVIAIILIIAAIAIPKLDKARMYANETAAIRQIGTIHTAQTQYNSQFGRFATSMEELGPPSGSSAGPSAADLIPGDLAKGDKTGYIFTMAGGPSGYAIHADPKVYDSTGRRTFFSDQTMVIRQNWGKDPANEKSEEIK